jgi:hypothetical protein
MTEPMSASVIRALNSAALSALRREASRLPEGLPREPMALLTLARWGLENLPMTGLMEPSRDAMEAALLAMERQADGDPGAVQDLVVVEAGEVLLRPSDLNPDLDSAASAVLDELANLVERRVPTAVD